MDAADIFYEKLLSSLGQPQFKEPEEPKSPPATLADRRQASSSPPPVAADDHAQEPTPPPPSIEPHLSKALNPEASPWLSHWVPSVASPTAITPRESRDPTPCVELSDDPEPSIKSESHSSTLPPTTPAQEKSSAALEAELRAKLLASSKKRQATGPPPGSHPPGKRPPHRGSPVFTAVPLTEEPGASRETAVDLTQATPLRHLKRPSGEFGLPRKPAQRAGFRLRAKLPCGWLPSGFMTVTTEVLPLYTPISAVLDCFNCRSAHDHLYFPSDRKVSGGSEDGEAEDVPGIAPGQRFYRDPSSSGERLPGWKELAAVRGAGWDGGSSSKLKATLEDVVTVAGADVVDCEVRCEGVSTPMTGRFQQDDGGDEHAEDMSVWQSSPQGDWTTQQPQTAEFHTAPWVSSWPLMPGSQPQTPFSIPPPWGFFGPVLPPLPVPPIPLPLPGQEPETPRWNEETQYSQQWNDNATHPDPQSEGTFIHPDRANNHHPGQPQPHPQRQESFHRENPQTMQPVTRTPLPPQAPRAHAPQTGLPIQARIGPVPGNKKRQHQPGAYNPPSRWQGGKKKNKKNKNRGGVAAAKQPGPG